MCLTSKWIFLIIRSYHICVLLHLLAYFFIFYMNSLFLFNRKSCKINDTMIYHLHAPTFGKRALSPSVKLQPMGLLLTISFLRNVLFSQAFAVVQKANMLEWFFVSVLIILCVEKFDCLIELIMKLGSHEANNLHNIFNAKQWPKNLLCLPPGHASGQL